MGHRRSTNVDDVHHETPAGSDQRSAIRRAPIHSEKFKLFELLNANEVGIALTERGDGPGGECVSGLYFAHPQANTSPSAASARIDRGLREAERSVDRSGRAVAHAEPSV